MSGSFIRQYNIHKLDNRITKSQLIEIQNAANIEEIRIQVRQRKHFQQKRDNVLSALSQLRVAYKNQSDTLRSLRKPNNCSSVVIRDDTPVDISDKLHTLRNKCNTRKSFSKSELRVLEKHIRNAKDQNCKNESILKNLGKDLKNLEQEIYVLQLEQKLRSSREHFGKTLTEQTRKMRKHATCANVPKKAHRVATTGRY